MFLATCIIPGTETIPGDGGGGEGLRGERVEPPASGKSQQAISTSQPSCQEASGTWDTGSWLEGMITQAAVPLCSWLGAVMNPSKKKGAVIFVLLIWSLN